MAMLSKACKPNNFELHNSLKLSFMNIWDLHLNFVDCKSFLESNSPDILAVWDKPGWLNWFWQFVCERLSSFNPKGFSNSYVWSCSLCEGRTSFCMRLISRKLCRLLLMFLTGFTSLSVFTSFSSIDHLLCLCAVFDSISSNIDEVLLINPYDN